MNNMHTQFIFLLIYLLGCITCYQLVKYIGKRNEWSEDTIAMGWFFSLISWFGVIPALIDIIVTKIKNHEKI